MPPKDKTKDADALRKKIDDLTVELARAKEALAEIPDQPYCEGTVIRYLVKDKPHVAIRQGEEWVGTHNKSKPISWDEFCALMDESITASWIQANVDIVSLHDQVPGLSAC